MDFVDFLRAVAELGDYRDTHVRAQWRTMIYRRKFLPSLVIRIEDPEGWAQVREHLPELPDLPERNRSGAPDWEPLVAGEAGDIIRRRWARDFEMFGYET